MNENKELISNLLPSFTDFTCTICLGVLTNTIQTSTCSHLFCSSCFKEYLKSFSSNINTIVACPNCRGQVHSTVVVPAIDRLISNWPAQCNLAPNCTWNGTRGERNDHIKSKCQLQEETCPDCKLTMIRAIYLGHRNICPNRIVQCEFCSVKCSHNNLKDHHNIQCLEIKIPCPNDCKSEWMSRKLIDRHLGSSCPFQMLPCILGCGMSTLRRVDMESHIKSNEYFDIHKDTIWTKLSTTEEMTIRKEEKFNDWIKTLKYKDIVEVYYASTSEWFLGKIINIEHDIKLLSIGWFCESSSSNNFYKLSITSQMIQPLGTTKKLASYYWKKMQLPTTSQEDKNFIFKTFGSHPTII